MSGGFPPMGFFSKYLNLGPEVTSEDYQEAMHTIDPSADLEEMHVQIGKFLERCGYSKEQQEQSLRASFAEISVTEMIIVDDGPTSYLTTRATQEYRLLPESVRPGVLASLARNGRNAINANHPLTRFQVTLPSRLNPLSCYWIACGKTVGTRWRPYLVSGKLPIPGYEILRIQYRIGQAPNEQQSPDTLLCDNPSGTLYLRRDHLGKIITRLILRGVQFEVRIQPDPSGILVTVVRGPGKQVTETLVAGEKRMKRFLYNFGILLQKLFFVADQFSLFNFEHPQTMEGIIAYPKMNLTRDDYFAHLSGCFDLQTI